MRAVGAYRRMTGLSQENVAKVLGISTNSYSNKERGVTQFKQNEMLAFVTLIKEYLPNIKIEDVFMNENLKLINDKDNNIKSSVPGN